MHKQLECFFAAYNNRQISMTRLMRGCRDLKQRACKIIFAWHLAEYLNDIELITRSSRPAKDNRTYISENRQKALGAGDRSALVDTTHRRTNNDVVVNSDKRQRSKFWKLFRQFAHLPFDFAEPFYL
jgi:hypothetical protein